MAIIYSYPKATIASNDFLLGTKRNESGNPTKSFLVSDFITLLADAGVTGPQGPTGPTGATGPQGEQGVPGPIGPAGLNWQGSWASGTSYVADDAVGYGGASYFCILATSGTTNPASDTAHWALLASQGATGPQGPTGATGTAGATGPQGATGATGATGPQGPMGPQGPAGTLIPWLEYNQTDLTVWNNGKGNIGNNTSFGVSALRSNTSGSNNTAYGGAALYGNTEGIQNTAIGATALQSNQLGSSNTALGPGTLYTNSSGSNNVAIGVNVLSAGTAVSDNIGVGNGALFNTTSISNVAIGSSSLTTITNGQGNTAIGYWSGRFAGGASTKNVYIGYSAGPTTTTTESNKLYIANSPGNPLIGGDFQTGLVNITSVLKLTPLASFPFTGGLEQEGMIAVVGTTTKHIYCYLNGGWQQLD